MKKKPFVIRVRIKYAPIEDVMNDADQKRTGLNNLSGAQRAALNEWLDKNAVLAPGHTD
jgi:hypothetical protein